MLPAFQPALITLAHGSRHRRASFGVDSLTRAAARRARTDGNTPAFLDFEDPSLIDAADGLSYDGIDKAVVVPLLFCEGYHQNNDVPEALAEARAAVASDMELLLAEPLGLRDDVAECVATHALRAATPNLIVIVYAVGSSVPGANDAVEDFADRVGKRLSKALGAPVTTAAAFATRGGVDIVKRAVHENADSVVVVPLFVTDGLLLQSVSTLAEPEGPMHGRLTVLPPLKDALADVVVARYRAALAGDEQK